MIEQADNIYEQLDNIFPSAKAPLYRRLMADDELTYLREDGGIIGFELDIGKGQLLAGFLLIAIQKHTVYAYRSDLHEEYKLVLFPPLDKMFDRTFEMLDLEMKKCLYLSDDFEGRVIKSGKLRELAKNLMPPEKDIDLTEDVSERMFQEMEKIRSSKVEAVKEEQVVAEPIAEEPVEEMPPMNEEMPPMNDFDEGGFDDFDESCFNDFDDHGYDEGLGPDFDPFEEEFEEEEEEEIEDWRIKELRDKNVDDLAALGEFVEMRLEVPKAVATQVLNKALQSEVVVKKKMKSVELAKMLFEKLFVDGKL